MAGIDALSKVCEVWPGADADAVCGVVPSFVAAPVSVEQVSELMRAAASQGLAVVARGGGTKLGWGAPPSRLDLLVDTGGLDQVIEHAAGDLVVKAGAGLSMDRLAEVLATAGQQLALDVPLPGATIGGTLATAMAGPRRLLYGTARDLLIGITVVRADGVVARAGGKVVKNVAGYDLGKLFTGSYGTLGLIVEAAFRLHPLPAARSYISSETDDPVAWASALLRSPLAPSAIEIDRPPHGTATVTVLLEGSTGGVAARAASACALIGGEARDEPPEWWGRYPGATDTGILAAVSVPPQTARQVLAITSGFALRGSLGTGVIYVWFPAATPAADLARQLEALRSAGSVTVLSAPHPLDIDRWGAMPALTLMRRVKDQFDPEHRLAPGRFAGGI